MRLSSLEKRRLGVYKYLREEQRREGQAFLSGIQWQDKRQWALTKIRKFHLNIRQKPFFYSEGDQRVEQVGCRVCGGSILGDTQNQAGHGPQQPCLSQGLD